jgi:hypothetical protein
LRFLQIICGFLQVSKVWGKCKFPSICEDSRRGAAFDLLTPARDKKLHQKLKSEEMKKASRLLCWLRATIPFRLLHLEEYLSFTHAKFLIHEEVPIQRTIFATE